MHLVWILGQGEELKLLRQRGQWLCQVRTDLRCSEQNIQQLKWLNVSSSFETENKITRQTSNQSSIGNLHTVMYFISGFETS